MLFDPLTTTVVNTCKYSNKFNYHGQKARHYSHLAMTTPWCRPRDPNSDKAMEPFKHGKPVASDPEQQDVSPTDIAGIEQH